MPKPLRPLAALAILLATCLAGDASLPRNLHAELNPPPVPGVTVRKVTPTSADLEWPVSLSPATRFRVEMRRFALAEDRELKMEWVDFPDAAISRHGEFHRARLRGLTPRQPYWFRGLPSDPAGAEPLFAVRFDTPAQAPVFTPRRIALGVLLAVLLALAWLRWRR